MPIGNSPDLPEYDKEREMEQREMDKCYEWWDSLNDEEQYNLMLSWYPNEFNFEECSADSFFGDMSSDKQLWIWKREEHITEEDLQAQADSIGDIEYDEKKLRGDDINV